MWRSYLTLTKPGIIFGNTLAALAAGVFAFPSPMPWGGFLAMLLGISFVIASACVLNNIYDQDIDAKMLRTKSRPMPSRRISNRSAYIFAAILLSLGVFFLYFTTYLALGIALIGFFIYVFAYTPLKHKSGYALYVGAVAGATPPVVGYTAATGSLDLVAFGLFAFLFIWQLPHFISIAAYRFEEYEAAGIPLLVGKPKNEQSRAMARKVFYASLIVLLLACFLLMLQR